MIPPRPWRIGKAIPWYPGMPVYLVDAEGGSVIQAVMPLDVAELIVGSVNGVRGWCRSHQRPATHTAPNGGPCCDPAQGGITLPCNVEPLA